MDKGENDFKKGRPFKEDSPRSEQLHVRMTEERLLTLRKQAAERGLGLSDYVSSLIDGADKPKKPQKKKKERDLEI